MNRVNVFEHRFCISISQCCFVWASSNCWRTFWNLWVIVLQRVGGWVSSPYCVIETWFDLSPNKIQNGNFLITRGAKLYLKDAKGGEPGPIHWALGWTDPPLVMLEYGAICHLRRRERSFVIHYLTPNYDYGTLFPGFPEFPEDHDEYDYAFRREFPGMVNVLAEHIIKLQTANLYVSQTNHDTMATYLHWYDKI